MRPDDKYLVTHNLGLLQRQAGVDPEIAEIVQAFARLRTDAGVPVSFGPYDFAPESPEARLLSGFVRRNPTEDLRVLAFLACYGGILQRRGLPTVFSVAHLRRRLALTRSEFGRMGAQPRRYYRSFSVPKPDGSSREIFSPCDRLRRVQQWIHHRILKRCPPHSSAHGFTVGRSIVTNAALHVGRQVVVRIDIRDFFPSIGHRAVRRVFQKVGYPYGVALALTRLCTIDGRLPQGAVTSPSLANLACMGLDRRMTGLATKLGCTYSRYADDLVFSSEDRRLPSVIPFFFEVLRNEGFEPNIAKTRVMFRSRRQFVTGIVINDHPALPRERRRRLRAAAHRLRTAGPQALDLPSRSGRCDNALQVLDGHLAFMRMVRSKTTRRG